jgi:SAM-dependent methyltransferase
MGLGIGAITLLLEEDRRRPFGGSVVTLGRQSIEATGGRLAALLLAFGKTWPETAVPDDETLLNALGFCEVVSLDASDFERPTRLLDLNSPETPPDLVGRFDVVLDSGTLEHVFHLPNALAHVGRMVRPGGRIIHLAPSSNYFDHGFYMFSPTLFFDYYEANGARVEAAKLVRHAADGTTWDVFDYDPQGWNRIGVGGLDGKAYLFFIVVTAPDRAVPQRIPSQSYYVDAWRRAAGDPMRGQGGVRGWLARIPGGMALARQLRGAARRAMTGTVYGKRRVERIRL